MKNSSGNSSQTLRWLVLSLVAFLPSLAQAHPGMPGHSHGIAGGLAHPLAGLDHICAMLAVGLWAAQRGGRAIWLVPLTFVSVMALGGISGMGGISIPFVEQGIMASVLILGLLIASAVRLPMMASVAVVALFALFHGYAHGAEMPQAASGLSYGIGFMTATAGLHLCGIGVGLAAKRLSSDRLVRYAGGAIAACGLALCFV